MASRPIMARLIAAIKKDGGERYIFDQVIEGIPIKHIMAPYNVTRGMFYWWLQDGGQSRKDTYEIAKSASAEAHVELAGEILEDLVDGCDLTNQQVSLAGKRSDYHRYLARIRDREQFGEKESTAVQINLSIGDSHLAALKELGRMSRIEEIPAEIVEAEFIPIPAPSSPSLEDLFDNA